MHTASESDLSENEGAGPVATPHILLVEDYPANVLVATAFLELFGYSYDVASNGHEAVEKATHGKYAVILMDVQMQGLNGFEATGKIREHEQKTGARRVPIIGMTAHALAGDSERCIAAGMDDYISKPFNPNNFKDLLHMHAQPKVA